MAEGPNLVQNGDFETGNLTDWTITYLGGGAEIFVDYEFPSFSYVLVFAYDWSKNFYFSEYGVSQAVTVKPNTRYRFSFLLVSLISISSNDPAYAGVGTSSTNYDRLQLSNFGFGPSTEEGYFTTGSETTVYVNLYYKINYSISPTIFDMQVDNVGLFEQIGGTTTSSFIPRISIID